jgi:hypothetical protein
MARNVCYLCTKCVTGTNTVEVVLVSSCACFVFERKRILIQLGILGTLQLWSQI